MITLELIHETINLFRQQAAEFHDLGTDISDDCKELSAQYARLAMAWHDVVRGCRTDEDLHMRLAEHELGAVVKAFAADREAAK